MGEQSHLEIILEDMNSKFDIVLEGYAVLHRKIDQKFDQLSEKVDQNSFLIDTLHTKIDNAEAKLTEKIDGVAADLKATDDRLSKKIDGVVADLKAHRADTEVHSGVYQVRES